MSAEFEPFDCARKRKGLEGFEGPVRDLRGRGRRDEKKGLCLEEEREERASGTDMAIDWRLGEERKNPIFPICCSWVDEGIGRW